MLPFSVTYCSGTFFTSLAMWVQIQAAAHAFGPSCHSSVTMTSVLPCKASSTACLPHVSASRLSASDCRCPAALVGRLNSMARVFTPNFCVMQSARNAAAPPSCVWLKLSFCPRFPYVSARLVPYAFGQGDKAPALGVVDVHCLVVKGAYVKGAPPADR